MTYRGKVDHGVVVLVGEKPPEGTWVDVIPATEGPTPPDSLASHPAVGVWKDRTDLPEDSVEASKMLRERLMRRADE
ncbi:MAG TPA: hypothetical protein VLI90_20045 [Tepidisphaeraceae bacterium]|nr:hypothetical protein [Tepidisphaeraceae bacterium]